MFVSDVIFYGRYLSAVHPIRVDGLGEQQRTSAEAATRPMNHHTMKQPAQLERRDQQQTAPVRTQHGEDIGATTREGMPIVLRSVCSVAFQFQWKFHINVCCKHWFIKEVDEDLHHKWYKRMYNTLHKVHQDGKLSLALNDK